MRATTTLFAFALLALAFAKDTKTEKETTCPAHAGKKTQAPQKGNTTAQTAKNTQAKSTTASKEASAADKTPAPAKEGEKKAEEKKEATTAAGTKEAEKKTETGTTETGKEAEKKAADENSASAHTFSAAVLCVLAVAGLTIL